MSKDFKIGHAADMHVHLRDGEMMELVTPTIRSGGISVAYVMPNLTPPITTIEQVQSYHAKLQKLSPETTFLMTFYLSHELTPQLVREAAESKVIRGIKCYPAGVTTNSKYGVDPNDFSAFYPIFEVMQQQGLVLNLHGEKPSVAKNSESDETEDIHVLNAEPAFLPALEKLHADFPRLQIVLEHCTTKAAIDIVRKINAETKEADPITVAASITAHHLFLSIDEWAGNPINFCKPVAKLPSDRRALVEAATSGEPWFFFGSDSAPHPIESKSKHVGVCAGVFTQSHALSYVAEAFDVAGKLENMEKFVSKNGQNFYNVDMKQVGDREHQSVWMVKRPHDVPQVIGRGAVNVVPFKAGESLQWTAEWR